MSKKLILLVVIFCALFGLGSSALADTVVSQAQVIHIHGIVPDMRILYIQNGNLIKVGGNTTENVAPQGLDVTTNNATDISAKVMQQYQLFLDLHGGKLSAGYYLVPSAVAEPTASPDAQAFSSSFFKLSV